VEAKAGSMKEIEYPVITRLLEPHGADDAGDAQEIDSHGHSGKAGDKPEEGSRPGAGGSKEKNRVEPMLP